MLLRSVLSVIGGLMLSAAFEPIALPWLLPFAVASFALVTRGLGVRRAGLLGTAFGAAFMLAHLEWLRTSIGTDAWIALSVAESLFYGLLGLGVPLLRRLPWWPLWLAAAWTSMETLRGGWPFSGLPWGRLSFAAIDTPAAPAVAYVGMTGLSFVLALVGFLVAHVAAQSWPVVRRRAADRGGIVVPAGVLVAVIALLVTPAVFAHDAEQTGTTTVAVVQGNVPGRGDDVLHDTRGLTQNHVDATVALAADVAAGRRDQPDFVVWPENSTALDPFLDASVNRGINEAADAIGVPVLVGGIVDDGPDHILNQGIVWDPVTGPGERYTKHHPVPYGEYIPYRRYWDPQFGQLKLISRDMRSGTRTTPLRVAGVDLADAICFDIAYDDVLPAQVRAGAQLLTVQTSNASFIFTDQIEQQFAITRLRAIEAGRWLAVASTNGRSGVIAPDGSVVASATPRTTSVLVEEVGLSVELTPAMRLGAWPSRVFTALTLLALVLGAIAYRRGRESAGPELEEDVARPHS